MDEFHKHYRDNTTIIYTLFIKYCILYLHKYNIIRRNIIFERYKKMHRRRDVFEDSTMLLRGHT